MTSRSAFIDCCARSRPSRRARAADDAAVLEVGGDTPRPHPRHDRRGRPFPARRSARRRRLEAGRGEPVRSRRQGRAADRRAARLHASAMRRGTGRSPKGSPPRSPPSACPCSAATRWRAPARVLGLTAIGRAAGPVPSRAGARPGDQLWVSGTIGDAGGGAAGCCAASSRAREALVERYRNPRPRLEAGAAAGAAGQRDDGRLGRPADRRGADGGGERLRRSRSTSTLVPLSDACLAACGDDRGPARGRDGGRRLRIAVRRRRRSARRPCSRSPRSSASPFTRIGACVGPAPA